MILSFYILVLILQIYVQVLIFWMSDLVIICYKERHHD